MEIVKLTLGNYQMSSNCYLLIKDNEAVVIDPGFDDSRLYDYLKNRNLKVNKIILTHGHFDHWGGLKGLRNIYPDALLYASTLDHLWYEVGVNNYYHYEPKIDVDLNELKTIELLGNTFKIFKLPGHSAGSIGLYFNKTIFSGDVLFENSIGRTDLLQGDLNTLFNSIKQIYTLDNETIIYSGHGRPTTVLNEKLNNPFIKG